MSRSFVRYIGRLAPLAVALAARGSAAELHYRPEGSLVPLVLLLVLRRNP